MQNKSSKDMNTITIKHEVKTPRCGISSKTKHRNALDVSLDEEKAGMTNSYDSLEVFFKKMNQ